MKKTAITVFMTLCFALGTGLLAQTQPDNGLFQEAKILIFDKKWEDAQAKLEELLTRFPDSPLIGPAKFYRAECLNARKGREREALKAYQEYLGSLDRNPSLLEQSEGAIIDLAFTLYEQGDKGLIREIESRLDHSNKVVRYYAAYKICLVKDKRIASQAIPVLEQILKSEKDQELQDRARIALLRVSPERLDSPQESKPSTGAPRVLMIRIWSEGKKTVEVNIPWALADLTLSAILEDQKDALRKKGYDIEGIIKQVVESRELLRIEGDDSVIEIRIK